MTTDSLVVDTSVFVAATLRHEPHYASAHKLMQTLDAWSVNVLVPALLIPEAMSALRRNQFPLARVRQLVAAYRASRLTVMPVDETLADEAGEVALLQGTKGGDSTFLALARIWALPLITLDREQLERAPADVEALTPAQALAKWWPEEKDAEGTFSSGV